MSTLMKIQTKEHPSDDAYLAHLARTDTDAFAELYRRHVTSVYRYHMVHTSNVKDAEDLTSQTFMAALEASGLIVGQARLRLGSWESHRVNEPSTFAGTSPRSRWKRRFMSPPRACQPTKRQPGVSKWIKSYTP